MDTRRPRSISTSFPRGPADADARLAFVMLCRVVQNRPISDRHGVEVGIPASAVTRQRREWPTSAEREAVRIGVRRTGVDFWLLSNQN
jgi:hypothetical protein